MNASRIRLSIVYDGFCHLCSGSVAWIARRVPENSVSFVPLQSRKGSEALQAAGIDALDPESFLVIQDGVFLQRTAAVIAVLRVIGGGWKIAALILGVLPARCADRLYLWVARNRYKWFGRRDVCFIERRGNP